MTFDPVLLMVHRTPLAFRGHLLVCRAIHFKIFADVSELSIGKLEDDELNKGMKKVRVKFTLGKGSYATIVIKEMFGGDEIKEG